MSTNVYNSILLSLMKNVDGPSSDRFMMRSGQWPDDVLTCIMSEPQQCEVAAKYLFRLGKEAGIEEMAYYEHLNHLASLNSVAEFEQAFNVATVVWFQNYNMPVPGVMNG